MARPKLCTKYKVYSFTAFENIAEGMSNVLCHATRHWPLGHVTSSVTWPFACPWAISYRRSIGTETLSPRDFEILMLKYIWVAVLTFLGHVTSSVTWPFFPRYVVSYRWSVDTSFLTGTVREIFGCKSPITPHVKPSLHFPCVSRHIAHCACAVSRDLVEGG